jgi:large subunit ribosomal protein L15
MPLTLHNIQPKKGAKKTKKRVGRGLASKGRYSGRGIKGQRSRSGGKSGLKLKGLRQNMLATPKARGFQSHKPHPVVVNLSDLNKMFVDGAKISPKSLLKKGLVSDITNGVKILGTGTLALKLTVTDCTFSEVAKEKLIAAGGTIIEVKKKPQKSK